MEDNNIKSTSSTSVYLAVFSIVLALTSIGLLVSGVFSSTDDLKENINTQDVVIAELQGKLDTINQQQGFSVDKEVKNDQFQAVFLTDGSTYFGRLSDGDLAGQVKLENIYYLRTGEYTQDEGLKNSAGGLSLAKLGNELHGPEDVMYISRDKMNFWENMKSDSEIARAITEYESQ